MPQKRTAPSHTGPVSRRGGPARLHLFTSIALLLMVAAVPLPFASARPLYWAIWSVYLGLVALTYAVVMLAGKHQWRVPPNVIWPAALLFLATSAYLAIQLVPFGSFHLPVRDGVSLGTAQISVAPNMTLLTLLKQLTYGLLFLLFMQVSANRQRRQLVSYVLLAIVLGYALYGIVGLQSGDTILGMPKWAYLGSATSTFVNRNAFATFLGMGAMIALGRACALVVRQSQRHKSDGLIKHLVSELILHIVAYLFLLTVLVATQSRMGLVATIAGSIAILVLTLATTRKLRQLTWLVPAMIVPIAIALILYGDGLLSRIGDDQLSTSNRLLIYQQALELLRLRPLTGFGGGSFEQAFQLVHTLPLSPEYVWAYAHSTYLTLWTELGLLVGTLPMLGIGYLAWKILRSLGGTLKGWATKATSIGAITVCSTHALVDFSLEIPAVTVLFVALLALGISAATTSD